MSSLISNMIARLGLDSADFERGASRARQSMYQMTAETRASQQAFSGMLAAGAKITAIAGIAYGVYRAVKSMASATIEAERADRRLAASLSLTGQASKYNLDLFSRQAAELSKSTVFSTDVIKQQMAVALDMGMTSDLIVQTTKAVIGLSAAYGTDLPHAMHIMALAAEGSTHGLHKLGIAIKSTATAKEVFDAAMKRGLALFPIAEEDAKTLGGTMVQLRNEWNETKDVLVRPFTPSLVAGMRAIRDAMAEFNEIKISINEGGPPQEVYQKAIAEYRQQVGRLDPTAFKITPQIGGGEAPQPPKFQGKWSQIWQRYREDRAARSAAANGEGASAFSPISEAARQQVIKLNEDLRDQIRIEQELAKGNIRAAETIRFRTVAEATFGKGTKESWAAITKYESGLAKLNETRGRNRIRETVEAMEDENQVLSLIRNGRESEARVLEVVNDLRRKNIKLLPEERAEIEKLIEANEKLRKGYGNDVGAGIRGSIKRMKDDLGGVGDLAADLTTEGIDGLASSLNDAAIEGKNLNESLKEVGRSMAKMAAQWAMKQLLTTALTSLLPGPKAPGVGSTPASRLGNIFDRRGIVPFARGGVVNRPTLFPFARGTGLMGESGPEAIMPLQRDRSGNLGVRSSGAGGSGRTDQLLIGILRAIQQQQLTANVAVVRSEDEILGALRTRRGRQNIMQIVQESQ